MSAEEWEAIPDVVADHTLKFKQGQNKKDSFLFTPVPDYLIAGGLIRPLKTCKANMRLSHHSKDRYSPYQRCWRYGKLPWWNEQCLLGRDARQPINYLWVSGRSSRSGIVSRQDWTSVLIHICRYDFIT